MLAKLVNKKTLLGIAMAVLMGVSLMPGLASANDLDAGAGAGNEDTFGLDYVDNSGLGQKDLRETVGDLIRVGLSIIGIVLVILFLFNGFKWMTAGGDSGKIDEAKKGMTAAVIGLAIALSAYAISIFVLRVLSEGTGSGNVNQELENGNL